MTNIAIYVEGGGDTQETSASLRRGMSAFLKDVLDAVRQRRIRWRIVACGGRRAAYDAFVNALRNAPDVFNVLLVDSEEPVARVVSPWEHLGERQEDQWARPMGADDSRCQMMVACMEAWFLADPAGLRSYFGHRFNDKALISPGLAEKCSTNQINDLLKKATQLTPAGEYRKIRDGAKLLEKVDPNEVRKHCRWCDRLFNSLGSAIGVDL